MSQNATSQNDTLPAGTILVYAILMPAYPPAISIPPPDATSRGLPFAVAISVPASGRLQKSYQVFFGLPLKVLAKLPEEVYSRSNLGGYLESTI